MKRQDILPLRKKTDISRMIFISLCLLPAFLILIVFMYYPIEETFRLSLTNSSGIGDESFIGLDNYVNLFSNDEFLAGLSHVFSWAFWSIVVQLPLAFVIAFALTYYKTKLTGPLRAVYYLANVLPSAITAMLGHFIFSGNNGIVISLAKMLGWEWLMNIDFLGDPSLAFWTVFAVATWTYTGFPIVFLMSRMEQISKDIREAADLDGVSGWKYAWFIVLPQLVYPMQILAVLSTVGSLKLFDLPYLLTSGGPGNATVTLGITLYRNGFVNWQYGLASAIGVIIFILSLIFSVLMFSWNRKDQH